jgi:hypothetical protein
MKEFIKEWKPKKVKEWNKRERQDVLRANLDDIVKFYLAEGHHQKNREVITELFDRMQTPQFVKTLQQLLDGKKGETPARIDLAFAMVINDFMESRFENLDEETVGAYSEVVNKLLKKRVKKVAEETGLDKDLIKELLIVVSHPEVVTNDRYIGVQVRNILRKIYTLAKENEDLGLDSAKKFKKLFKALFGGGDTLNYVAVAVLLERKDTIRNFNEGQTKVWNLLTEFALETLEDNKKKYIEDLIVDRYVSLRLKEDLKQRDSARRIQFSSISEQSYPKLREVTKDLAEKDKFKKYL